jgi:phosphohistidine phosphatase
MSDTEIQLHFLRHAHAGDPMKWHGPDDARPLSEKGRDQAAAMGRFLAAAAFRPDAIVSSPKLRAVETAQIVAEQLGMRVATTDALAGPLDLPALAAVLTAAGNPTRPLLVGHDPDFSELAALLIGAVELPLRKGALARIDVVRPLRAGTGVLRWLVPPDLLTGPE